MDDLQVGDLVRCAFEGDEGEIGLVIKIMERFRDLGPGYLVHWCGRRDLIWWYRDDLVKLINKAT